MEGNNILDILIPVFNEDETIVKTIENIFSAVKYDYKIIICYDYDEDPTLKIIKESFPHNSKIVFVKNFSQGFNNALISGFILYSVFKFWCAQIRRSCLLWTV